MNIFDGNLHIDYANTAYTSIIAKNGGINYPFDRYCNTLKFRCSFFRYFSRTVDETSSRIDPIYFEFINKIKV